LSHPGKQHIIVAGFYGATNNGREIELIDWASKHQYREIGRIDSYLSRSPIVVLAEGIPNEFSPKN